MADIKHMLTFHLNSQLWKSCYPKGKEGRGSSLRCLQSMSLNCSRMQSLTQGLARPCRE